MKVMFRYLVVVLFLLGPLCMDLMAQPPVGGQPPCWPPPCIPIDGGLGFLLVAGAALGGKKAMELRRSAKKPS